jgi:Tol biopolymer transport system component
MFISVGSQLGAYEILSLLGKGGMGEVYRARDGKLKREVAIKILPDEFSRDHERAGRFQREAEVLASLNHANIAGIYDIQESGEIRFLVLELIEGETLADRIRRGPMPMAEVLPIARQIAEALEAAHDKGIVHRDLKPANVKILPDGKVKVLDFGLAKAMEGRRTGGTLSDSPTMMSMTVTQPGMILGTAPYMSPEQANGFDVDARSDIFSFGCVLYEMLTGRRAFQGQTVSEVIASVLAREPDMTSLPPNLHPRVRHVLRRALEKNLKQRWQSMVDVRMELDAATTEPAETAIRSRSRVPIAVAAIVLAVIAAWGAWKLKPAAVPRVTRFVYAVPPDQQLTNTGRQIVAVSPDGSGILYVANSRLYIRRFGEFNATPVPGSEAAGSVVNPVFSPDGKSIAFFSSVDASLKRIAVTGGTAATISAAGYPFGMSWGEGDRIVYGLGRLGIMEVSAGGGTPHRIISVEEGDEAHGPQILPGGEWILFTLSKGGGADRWSKAAIVVQSLKSGERKTLINGGSDARYAPTGHLIYAQRATILAIPFDLQRLEVKGGPTPVLEGVRPAPIGNTGTSQFSFSPDGTLAYVTGESTVGTPSNLALILPNGATKILPLPPAVYGAVRFSPDGKLITFFTDEGAEAIIWVYDLSGNLAARRLTFGGRNRYPIWSSDGQKVIYTSNREGDNGLFSQRADGTGPVERLTKSDPAYYHQADSMRRDGSVLAFSNVRAGAPGDELWIYSLSDKKTTVVARGEGADVARAAFSPDGQWLAYQLVRESGRSASGEADVIPWPANGAKYQITNDGQFPAWSPDGTQLFFTRGTPPRLFSVSIQSQAGFAFGNPTPLSVQGFLQTDTRQYDVSPDGKQFIVQLPPQRQSTSTPDAQEIRVVLNWFEELKQRVPVSK